jgi:hypothetical protein
MPESRNPAREMLTDALGAPDGAVSVAWDAVKRHPLASLGAVAAGVGAYVLLRHFEGGSRASGRARSGRATTTRATRATRATRTTRSRRPGRAQPRGAGTPSGA